jgi:hemoglobin/transferrin/lactoferrin receptor protein
VTVLDADDIERVPPSSVAQVLRDIPGVSVTESGIERIRIRGESSQRVAIMIDGQRISDHSNYGTPILISPTEIERVEVVRGPSSVVSGNSAIGGVINIITKRGADKPVEITTRAGYLGANDGYRASASVAGTVDNVDYRLSFSKSDLGDRETTTGPLTPSGSADRDIHAFLGYRMGNHYIGLRAQDYDLSADVYTGSPDFSIDLPKRDLRKYGVFYEGEHLTPWMSMLKLDAYTQTVDRQFRNAVSFAAGPTNMNVRSTSDDDQDTSGFKATAHLEFAPGHRTVVGFEYEDDRLQTAKTSTTTTTPPFGPPTITTSSSFADASIKTSSLFAQHEATFGQLTGTFGLRYYDVSSSRDRYVINGADAAASSSSDDRLLGSAGLVYSLSEDTVLRASISQGYTFPSLSQLYLTSTGGGGTTIGNPDLKPETATNYEIGLRLDRSAVVLDAALFYTEAKDYIAAVATGTPRTSQYENVNRAETWGFDLSAEFNPGWSNGIRPYVSLSHLNRDLTFANGLTARDTGTPDWSGVAGLRGDWVLASVDGTWDLFARSQSGTVKLDSSGAADATTARGGWSTLNLRGSVNISENTALSFELGNLLDKAYKPADQEEAAGRYVSLFLTAKF